MIAIYCAVRDLERRLERSVPEEREPITVRVWDEFESTATRADCSVVLITWLPGASETESLATFQAPPSQHPVVLVTRGDMTNACALAGMGHEPRHRHGPERDSGATGRNRSHGDVPARRGAPRRMAGW